jgi:NADH dehydrogenase [ubiquinone] 1 alpha subcomplex assembly factor 7
MTPLERALRERIRTEGPIGVDAFMEACNAYYYATRDPFGVAGDFTTAPEISQMFGEMVGACLADCWKRAGALADAVYAEPGPGRGTLAGDALRVMRGAGFGGDVHFVETSPILRDAQRQAVPDADWHEAIDGLPERPLLVVANEFLDALPIGQFVDGASRRITLTGGHLAFDRDGETVELSPAREDAVRSIAGRLLKHGGVALIIDYGHAFGGRGDTLQAVRGHRFSPVLASPGEQDLTSHVDFGAVERSAREAGAAVTRIASQGSWLKALGIETRAAALAASNAQRFGDIDAALHRLTASDAMGDLFKVIAIHSPAWPAPAGLE